MMVYIDNDIYIGMWENDMAFGEGKLIRSCGELRTGNFQNGKLEGQGKVTRFDRKTLEPLWCRKGNFIDDMLNGFGEQENFKTKAKYIGNFVNSRFHGTGAFTYSNGVTIKANWVNNKQHGLGCITENGEIRDAQWDHGRQVRIWQYHIR
jgi:hypothetical protein